MVPDKTNSPKNGARDVLLRYTVAVASVIAGLLLRFALAGVLGSTVPYITLFPSVMFAAWFGGLGPGILATALSLLAALYFVVSPVSQLRTATPEDTVGAVIFVAVSVFISILNEAVRRSRAGSERRLRELALEVTLRSRVERELAESRREAERARDLFQTTLASIGDAVIAADSAGKVTFLNTVAEQLTGWSRADAMGKPVPEVFAIQNEKTGMTAENPVDKAIREGTVAEFANHTVLISKDGSKVPVEDSAAPIKDGAQRILGAVLVFRDVSKRRASEAALAGSQERLRLALEACEIGVWDWDVVQNRMQWSDRLYDIHGVDPDSFSTEPDNIAELTHPDDRGRISDATRAALREGSRYDIEYRIIPPDGNVVWLSTTALVFRNEKGEPTRMLGATTDITDRKDAEAIRLQQWHTFDIALSNTPDFTYIFNLEGRFTYLNRALLSLLQIPLAEALGKNFFDLGYPPELAGRLQRQIQQVIATRQALRDETPFTGPAGETRQYEYIFVPVLAPDGRVEAVAGSTRDVTDRMRVEAALRTSEERLTLALEAAGGVGTWDYDVASDRLYCDARFAQLFSVNPQRAAAGAPIAEFVEGVYPDDRGMVTEKVRHALQTGGEYSAEYRVSSSDGLVHWVTARGRAHLDQAGNPNRFLGVVIDITERKRSEQELRENQGRLRAIYDGTYEYIGLLAPDGTLLEANGASLEFANYTRADVIGKRFWETAWFTGTPGAPELIRDAVLRAAAGEFMRFEVTVRRPFGECLTFDVSFHPIRNESGEVVLIVPEGRDITERKRAEEELKRSNENLTRANRELEEFAYVASHDLQEPLRMVNIYTQLIVQDLGADRAKLAQYADFVQQGVTRMDALIHDLLTFSRAVHSDELAVGTADLGVSLNEALSVLKNRIEESGSVITADPLPAVRGDLSQMAHVFQNLLSNAMKYRKKGAPAEIHIAAQWDAGQWILSVRDNGIGFEQQYAERIFGLFKRLHKGEYPGTGIGLAICKRIIERYGGRIWAEGRAGEGATFYFSLPRGEGH